MKIGKVLQYPLFVVLLISLTAVAPAGPAAVQAGQTTVALAQPGGTGPFVGRSSPPTVYNGTLYDLAKLDRPAFEAQDLPLPGTVGKLPAPASNPLDPVAQTRPGAGHMPDPIITFPGLDIADGGGWHPPDTEGDVGPNHYVQVVNIAIGIYDKATGQELVNLPYNSFFSPAPSPCNTQNRGDVVALYDPIVDRWLVTDFSLPDPGPYYECIAISQSGDPVNGGWYYYAFLAGPQGGPWNDYPKLAVWSDGYYMTANMFEPNSAAWVWALDRSDMLVGAPIDYVRFEPGYWSLLPSNVRGTLPPPGSPNYLLSMDFPDTLHLWKAYIDWGTPGNSHLDGPIDLTVAPFSPIWDIPQRDVGQTLDSLGDRLMFMLQYRNYGDHEALFVNHTVASGSSAGVRWYELRDPGGTPYVYQQGTFQPDSHYRWMGSIAADGEGNLALGYSVSSNSLYPSIRYTGQLKGETPGAMTQGEATIKVGTGSQTGSNRWGDYSAMTVDPVDDCTFWYTQEYVPVTGGDWSTYIGSFRFPTCGQAKGWVDGTVQNLDTGDPLPGAPVFAEGITMTFSTVADANGLFTMTLAPGTYTVTAGPFLPGYPGTDVVTVTIPAGAHVPVNLYLQGVPYLAASGTTVDDNVPGGNGNGYPEPGESGLLLYEQVANTGGATATDIGAYLTSLTPGVLVTVADSTYPDIAPGGTQTNNTPFVFSIAPTVTCGTRLDFIETLVTAQGNFTATFSLYAKVPLPRASFFADNMENGQNGWVPGGSPNTWALTTLFSHSPSHSWTDSPGFNYSNNTDNWVRSPVLDASGITGLQLSFWHRYDTESGYDYGYVEYSTDGGANWLPYAAAYDGQQTTFVQETLPASALDDQPNIAFRFRLVSDGGVVADGWYIDDVDLTYEPFACYYILPPTLVAPPDGTLAGTHQITFTWEPNAGGGVPDGYNLELDSSAVFTTTSTSLQLSLTAGLHSWRVRAYGPGNYSDYTAPWTLEVQDLPGVPQLLTPPDGALFTTTHDVTLTWQAGAGYAPNSYDLQLDGLTHTVTATTYPATLPAGDHTWRARACNAAGCSAYTAAWSFTVLDAPLTPTLVFPPDGALITTTHDVAFSWQAGAGSPVDTYDLEVNGTVYTTTGTVYTLTLPAGLFTWRVRATNAAGTSPWSAPWSGTVLDPAGVPVLVAPADGTLTSTATITFTWTAGPGGAPDGYNVELDGVVFSTTAPLWTATLGSGPHTWRVRAYNAAGYSAYSATWTVTVAYRVYLPLVAKQAP